MLDQLTQIFLNTLYITLTFLISHLIFVLTAQIHRRQIVQHVCRETADRQRRQFAAVVVVQRNGFESHLFIGKTSIKSNANGDASRCCLW